MIKKLSTSLVCAMMLLTTSAYAENDKVIINNISKFNQEIDVTSEIMVPTVQVTVPTKSYIILNPYKIPYGSDLSTDQIISQEIEIKNGGLSPVEVIMESYTTTTGTTGKDAQKPYLTQYENYIKNSTTKYVYLNLNRVDIEGGRSKNIYESSSTSKTSYGNINPSETMRLRFTGGMAQNAVWTGQEYLNIKPVFKIVTSEASQNN